ncbi:hypothetical protein [Streptomyces sp. NPDC052042]|uniref:hypothetical protein n=1 Tax=Streptomyces sp. NPDC052042 TaxID=3365683 RepID=UPI0037D5F860
MTEPGRTSGRAVERDLVENTTDRLAGRLLAPLAESTADALLAALEVPARQVLEAKLLPFPNPIGLPAPGREASGD